MEHGSIWFSPFLFSFNNALVTICVSFLILELVNG